MDWAPSSPGRTHSGFEVWPYAFQVLPPPSSRKGSFDPDPRASVDTFEAPEWEAARPADRPSTSQRPSTEVEQVGQHPERMSGVPTVGHVGELAPRGVRGPSGSGHGSKATAQTISVQNAEQQQTA